MISLKILPDIEYSRKLYTRFKNTGEEYVFSEIPIIDVYGASENVPLLVVAEGGQGKSTAINILRAELICRGQPLVTVRCKDVSTPYLDMLFGKRYPQSTVFLIDAWDELPLQQKSAASAFVFQLVSQGYKTVVCSRYNPKITGDADEKRAFSSFVVAWMRGFTDGEIFELVDGKVSYSDEIFPLLSNSMFVSMYLRVVNSGESFGTKIRNKAEFIYAYLKRIFEKKERNLTNPKKIFVDVGAAVYRDLTEGGSLDSQNLSDYSPLNGIIWERKDEGGLLHIDSEHLYFRTFCLGFYLKERLAAHIMNPRRKVPDCLCEAYSGDFLDALIFAGELLSEAELDAVRSRIDYTRGDPFTVNMLYLMLGANGLCFDDEYFGVTNERLESLECAMAETELLPYYEDFFLSNGFIKSLRLNSLTSRTFSSRKISEITVAKTHPELSSGGGCLLTKGGDELVLFASHGRIPDGVKRIGERAFDFCEARVEINLPCTVFSIGDHAFSGSAFEKIVLPDGLETVGVCAFSNASVEELLIPDTVREIGTAAFWGCEKLQSISLSCGVKEIDDDTFFACTSLLSIDIPDGVVRIGENAFGNCVSLSHISLPKSVTQISAESFDGCSSLSEILWGGSAYEWRLAFTPLSESAADARTVNVVCVDGVEKVKIMG